MRLFIAIILLIPAVSFAEESIGKFVQSDGFIRRVNINCSGADCGSKSSSIYPGERIKTSKESKAGILLADGTSLVIHGRSDVIINRVKLKERDRPTEIFVEKGKIQIIQKNSFMKTSLVVKTPVSITKSVNSEISIVSGSDETALFVYTGEAGFAGINPSRDEAFILSDGDESFVKRDESPSPPVKVERTLRNSWLGRHILSEDSRRVLIYKKGGSPADWPFIKND